MRANTIKQVITALDDIIEEEIAANSPLGYFPALYQTVTIAVKEGIAHDFFDDGPRMEKLDVIFANRYLEAYYNYKANRKCSKSWQLAFDNAKGSKLIVLQHLFIGMSPHINLDLGIAAAEVASGNAIKSLESDFYKINVVLGSLVDGIQKDLVRIWPALRIIDWIAGSFDEKLAKFSMDIARDGAWAVAKDLAMMGSVNGKESYINDIDSRVYDFSAKITNPRLILGIMVALIRLTERGDVKTKISHLM